MCVLVLTSAMCVIGFFVCVCLLCSVLTCILRRAALPLFPTWGNACMCECLFLCMYACMYACMHVLFEHVFESNAGMLKCMNAASCHVMKGCDFFAKGFEL